MTFLKANPNRTRYTSNLTSRIPMWQLTTFPSNNLSAWLPMTTNASTSVSDVILLFLHRQISGPANICAT